MDPEFPPYMSIKMNEFLHRKHKKQKDEDIAVCECQYDPNDPGSACTEGCLNVFTSTECTPGYCRCGDYCNNQKFQKCKYAKFKLFKTEGRGWGLLADEDIKAGQFVIEYCGEVISWKVARKRAHAYETAGSSQPNCETRKWNVLGEVRVGIFAKQFIPAGTELSYDYNFEWYGGAMVRCLCGSESCSGFLGAKSRGFQEAAYLWEDDDDRYSVENVPLYDSADDEPTNIHMSINLSNPLADSDDLLNPITIEPLSFIPMEVDGTNSDLGQYDSMLVDNIEQNFTQKSPIASDIQNNTTHRNHKATRGSRKLPVAKLKGIAKKQLSVTQICAGLASSEAQDEIFASEEAKNQATFQLNSVYDEIRPAIEKHERDNQDSVSTSVAEKWIEASCSKYKSDFDFYSTIIKNIAFAPRCPREDESSLLYLENGP